MKGSLCEWEYPPAIIYLINQLPFGRKESRAAYNRIPPTNILIGGIMLKPNRLKKGDRVAIVSLSKGMLGEEKFIHILDIARARLEGDYGLKVTVMPRALKGISWLYDHPEARRRYDPLAAVYRH